MCMLVTIHAQPNAKRNEIVSQLDEATLKVKVAAPAIEGKANAELLNFLAGCLHIRPSVLALVRGATTRLKQIEVPDEAWAAWIRTYGRVADPPVRHGTGSMPPGDQGWQRDTRRRVNQPPHMIPCRHTAMRPYSEQEG